MTVRSILPWALIAMAWAPPASSTTIKDVDLDALYREADVVALVAVNGSDSTAFKVAVYRAQVLQGFKGVVDKSTIFFGPHTTYGLGREYVVFLRRTGKDLAELSLSGAIPWPGSVRAPYLEIMYAGYGVLPVEYTCIIPGCDYGVSIPSSQVHLPPDTDTVQHQCNPGSNYDSWVRKTALLSILSTLAKGAGK